MLSLGSTQLEVGQQQQAGVLDEEVACVIATVCKQKFQQKWLKYIKIGSKVGKESNIKEYFHIFFRVQALESITSELKQHFQGVARNSVLPCSSPHIEIAMASMDIYRDIWMASDVTDIYFWWFQGLYFYVFFTLDSSEFLKWKMICLMGKVKHRLLDTGSDRWRLQEQSPSLMLSQSASWGTKLFCENLLDTVSYLRVTEQLMISMLKALIEVQNMAYHSFVYFRTRDVLCNCKETFLAEWGVVWFQELFVSHSVPSCQVLLTPCLHEIWFRELSASLVNLQRVTKSMTSQKKRDALHGDMTGRCNIGEMFRSNVLSSATFRHGGTAVCQQRFAL